MKDDIRLTLYIPPEQNDKLDFLKYKTKQTKNQIMLNALTEYLPKQLKKYPEYKENSSE